MSKRTNRSKQSVKTPFEPKILKPSVPTKIAALILILSIFPTMGIFIFLTFSIIEINTIYAVLALLWGGVIALSLAYTFIHMLKYSLIRTEKSVIRKGVFTSREFPRRKMIGYEVYGKYGEKSRIIMEGGERISSPYNRSFEELVGELKLREIKEDRESLKVPLIKWGTGVSSLLMIIALLMTMHLVQLSHLIQFFLVIFPVLFYLFYSILKIKGRVTPYQLQHVVGTSLLFASIGWIGISLNNDPNLSNLKLLPAGTFLTMAFALVLYRTLPRARRKMRESAYLIWLLGAVGFPLADVVNQVFDSSKPKEHLCFVDEKWHTSGRGATANIKISSDELELSQESFSIHFNDYNRIREKNSVIIYYYKGRFGAPWFSLKRR